MRQLIPIEVVSTNYTFWKEVDKFTKNLTSPIVINSWKHLANIRYNELLEVK